MVIKETDTERRIHVAQIISAHDWSTAAEVKAHCQACGAFLDGDGNVFLPRKLEFNKSCAAKISYQAE